LFGLHGTRPNYFWPESNQVRPMNSGSPLFTCYMNSKEWIIIHSPLFINRTIELRRGSSFSFLFCFCITSSCFYTPASLFLTVVLLLSMVAQGSSYGGNEEGRWWYPFFPSCSFLPFVSSLLLSFLFLSLFYFLLFPSSFSPFCLCFSLCLHPLFLNNHPHVSSLLGLPLFFTSYVSFSVYHPLCFKPFPQPSL